MAKNRTSNTLLWKKDSFAEINDWLKTFELAGLDKVIQNKGTIFRLPLRNERAVHGTNTDNEISKEIFCYEDFLRWCSEWKESAGNLLFLRSVHKLVLQEIDENGKTVVHVSIESKNHDEIQKIKKIFSTELHNRELDKLCTSWLNPKKELPVCKYIHSFNISYLSNDLLNTISLEESWAVVNGFFKGDNNELLKHADNVLKIRPNPRKVLPWAGAAVKLDNQKPVKSYSLFTFLPLPIDSKHPVFLHGWFDLNPKRTEITHGGDGHDKELLVKWNQLLMEFGVGKAWAILVDYIKNEEWLNDYYSFWPKHYEQHGLDKFLVTGFYKQIAHMDCLYVRNSNR